MKKFENEYGEEINYVMYRGIEFKLIKEIKPIYLDILERSKSEENEETVKLVMLSVGIETKEEFM
mgnify:CR=1 FL=1